VTDRPFVVVISERAMAHSIENIGQTLLQLNGHGITSGARSIEAVLHDVLRGIRDKVLLKSQLVPADLESLLRIKLGRDYKFCRLEWPTASV